MIFPETVFEQSEKKIYNMEEKNESAVREKIHPNLEFEKNVGRSLHLGGGLRCVRGLRGSLRGRGLGRLGGRCGSLRGRCGLGSGGLRGGGRRRERLKERIRKKKKNCIEPPPSVERLVLWLYRSRLFARTYSGRPS